MSRHRPVFLNALLFRNSENFRGFLVCALCVGLEGFLSCRARTHARGGSIREAGRIKDLRSRV
jgi:hypothetical protein